MATAITITRVLTGEFIMGNIALSGNYVAGGDTLDFTSAKLDPAFVGVNPPILDSSVGPLQLDCWIQGGANTDAILDYQLVPILGSALNNCKLMLGAEDSFGTEYTAGAYGSDVTGLKIAFSLAISKNI